MSPVSTPQAPISRPPGRFFAAMSLDGNIAGDAIEKRTFCGTKPRTKGVL
jgi:hypothetical protein